MTVEETPIFSALDRHFARFLAALAKNDPEPVALAAALASRAVGEGSVCLDLSKWAARSVAYEGVTNAPSLASWCDRLMASGVVGRPEEMAPLVLDHRHRLYLRRYWSYERRTADALLRRASTFRHRDPARMAAALARLFPLRKGGPDVDWQAVGAIVAAVKGLCILSGGPGTGKTYTAVRIMALMQALAHRPLKTVMAAPTGKAASRLMASVTAARSAAEAEDGVVDALPSAAFTLHRLLGIQPGKVRPRFHRENPLDADVVVVDEASMIDISLMCRLVEAVPDTASLILIGDRDQLSSVEAGAVFGDVCRPDRGGHFSGAMQEVLKTLLPNASGLHPGGDGLSDCLVFLTHAHRFGDSSVFGRLFSAVNSGDSVSVNDILASRHKEVSWIPDVNAGQCRRWLSPQIADRQRKLAANDLPQHVLEQLGQWQILCGHNKGPWGVDTVNRLAIETVVSSLPAAGRGNRGGWYAGMPLLILQNDYELGLYNGDIGLVVDDEATAGGLAAVFSGPEGQLKKVDPLRLPAHTPAYALTVHKSQGSEFDHVVLILPDRDTPLLSRELIYTGLTRAKSTITIVGSQSVLETALQRVIQRPSGLADALWKNNP